MDLVDKIAAMQEMSAGWRSAGDIVAVVPTMGFLHDGHTALIRRAREEADRVVVTIFVNPTQFGPEEDFDRYPRDLDNDLERCKEASVDTIFMPTVDEMYPEGSSTWVREESLSRSLCGVRRPDHFKGVTTVVCKLFHAVLPDVAVFGDKDFQQARVISRMVRDLNFPVRVVTIPTVRESDGLAMSSRNRYLSPEQRRAALSISRGLTLAREACESGTRAAKALLAIVTDEIEGDNGEIEYAECRDADNLEPVESVGTSAIIAVAVRFGDTRLIDNVRLG